MSNIRCFGRTKDEDPKLAPCSTTGTPAQCCSPGDSCAQNGFCLPPAGANTLTPYFVHGCTDQDWNKPTCITTCEKTGGNGISACGSGKFCCYGFGGCNCSDPQQVFTLAPVLIQTSIPFDYFERLASSSTSAPAGPSSSPTTSASTTSSASRASGTNAQSGSTSPPAQDNSGNGGGNGTAIGVGIGLGVGIPLLAAVIGLLWIYNRRQKRKDAEGYPPPVDHVQHMSQHPPDNWNGQQSVSPQSWGGQTSQTPVQPGWAYDNTAQKHELDPHPNAPMELPASPHPHR